MVRISFACIAALAACVVWVGSGRSEVIIRAPFTEVRVGAPGTVVRAPFTEVRVAAPITAVRFVDGPPPIPPEERLPPSKEPAAPKIVALTLEEFAHAFKAAPGDYEVWLIHPGSDCPVKVCFTLPCGCPKVCVTCRQIVFDYGHYETVTIRMAIRGKVRVVYHNV
jgi:hypothetical protein